MKCAKCGEPAIKIQGHVMKTCKCQAAVVVEMQATAEGHGRLQ